MTFAAPGWLALLLAVPVLWWLYRRMHAPREIVVSSVLLFRDDADTAPAVRPRRRIDREFVVLAAAMTLLAMAAAGPRLEASGPEILVVLDTSPSTAAVAELGGPSALERAAVRLEGLLAEAAPRVRLRLRYLHETVQRRPPESLLGAARPPERFLGDDGLPGAVAPLLALARREGFPGLVLLTDRVVDVPGVVTVGPDRPPLPNVAIAAASIDGGRLTVAVRNHADQPQERTLEAANRDGALGQAQRMQFGAHGSSEAVIEGVPRQSLRLRLRPPDGLDLDDEFSCDQPRAGAGVHVRDPELARLLQPVLDAAGFPLVGRNGARVVVQRGGEIRFDKRYGVLHFAPAPAPTNRPEPPHVVPGNRDVPGSRVVAVGDDATALPRPTTALVAPVRIEGGTPVWRDAGGVLVAHCKPREAPWSTMHGGDGPSDWIFAFDPLDPGSTWDRDPSFPVLVVTALERLTSTVRGWSHSTPIPASESALPDDVPPTPSIEGLRAAIRVAADRSSGAGGPLALGAALLLGSTAVFVTRRRSRAAP